MFVPWQAAYWLENNEEEELILLEQQQMLMLMQVEEIRAKVNLEKNERSRCASRPSSANAPISPSGMMKFGSIHVYDSCFNISMIARDVSCLNVSMIARDVSCTCSAAVCTICDVHTTAECCAYDCRAVCCAYDCRAV